MVHCWAPEFMIVDQDRRTFFTSARLSFFLTGLSLTSAAACCDLDPVDSPSDSEWLSDSEELLDSEWWARCFLSLPWSLSDWLPDSDTERLDSSDAELLHKTQRWWWFKLTKAFFYAQEVKSYCSNRANQNNEWMWWGMN